MHHTTRATLRHSAQLIYALWRQHNQISKIKSKLPRSNMGIFTHAIFDQCGNFKDWMTYIDGGYSLKAGELIEDCWGSKRVSELEKFLGEQHRAVPFDELTEADWLIIRRAKASNEQAQ